jgi:hypothetical protein
MTAKVLLELNLPAFQDDLLALDPDQIRAEGTAAPRSGLAGFAPGHKRRANSAGVPIR